MNPGHRAIAASRPSSARLGGIRVTPIALACGLVLLLIACQGQDGARDAKVDSPEDRVDSNRGPSRSMAIVDEGDFRLRYLPAEDPELATLAQEIRDAKVIEPEVDWLNQNFALPSEVWVDWLECGEDNAFYDAETRRVELCYEMVAGVRDRFVEDGDEPEDAFWHAMDTAAFFFHHEVGHAFVDLYRLPITGREEDAVDELAAITLIEGWDDGTLALMAAIDSFYLTGLEEEAVGQAEDLPFWDEHAFDLQRFYRIACLIYGSDPEEEVWLIEDGSVPREQADLCVEEYAQKRDSWGWLLDPYYLETAASP